MDDPTSPSQPSSLPLSQLRQKLNATFNRERISAHPEFLVIALLFLLNILLVSPRLMPAFTEINPYDEAKYVESGWLLLKGEVRSLAWGPLVALAYAPVHWFTGNSPDWFMLETWIGRFILFGFLWWSLVYLAYQLKDLAPPLVTVGLLFATAPLFTILRNQSDAVFVSFSVLGLANLIKFSRGWRLKNICLASICVGLGVLARVETVVLTGTLAVLAIAIGWKRVPVVKTLAAAILPAAGILAALFAVNLINQGDLNLEIGGKSYESFEVNQWVLTGGDLELATQESRRLFGTQEQNGGSVLRAILRNPPAFAARIGANVQWTARFYFTVFKKTQGFVLLLFSVWGVYTLARKRAVGILAMLFLWPLHALIALGFLARHVVPQMYFLPMILSAVGIFAALDLDSPPREKAALLLGSLLVGGISWADHKPAFLFGCLLLIAVFGLAWILRPRLQASGGERLAPLLLLLIAGLILGVGYPFPDYNSLGKSNEELAVHYIEGSLPARAKVLTSFPLPAVAARMVDVDTRTAPKDLEGAQELWAWFSEHDIRGVYVNTSFSADRNILAWLESGLGRYFDLGFTSADKKVRVFLVRDSAAIP
jgi:hypothetical protein